MIRKSVFSALSVILCTGGIAGISAARADEVSLGEFEMAPTGGIHVVAPVKLKMTAARPTAVTREPEYRNSPQYGVLTLGDAKTNQIVVALDTSPGNSKSRLYVDTNGDGDLTNDPAITLGPLSAKAKGISETRPAGTMGAIVPVVARYVFGTGVRDVPSSLQFTLSGGEVFYNREYGRAGKITINGQTYRAALIDQRVDGKFSDYKHTEDTPARVTLLIDRNRDGEFNLKREAFDCAKPFRMAGGAFEVLSINNRGSQVALRPSSKKIASTMKASDLFVGGAPIDFDVETTGGKTISFPDSYKGKVVMLDFWATWCPPCREEIPNIVAVYNQYHEQGFDILGISLDQANAKQILADYTQQANMPWPEVYDGLFWKAEIAQLYEVEAIPFSILVDGDTGKILAMGDSLRGNGLNRAVEQAMARRKNR